VDHEIPYRISFSHALDNLKCRCRSCHKKAEATRVDLWQGKTLGGHLGRIPKPQCLECFKKRKLLENGYCEPCNRDCILIPIARQMRENGRSYESIAKELSFDHKTVWVWLNGRVYT
jgi:transposase-like protein